VLVLRLLECSIVQNEISDVVVQPYNSILTLKRLTLHTDCVVSISYSLRLHTEGEESQQFIH
jgi:hypothetical protein